MLSWAYHPKALPLAVPAAALHMAAMRGMEVIVLRPDGLRAARPVMAKARARRRRSRAARVAETDDRAAALAART